MTSDKQFPGIIPPRVAAHPALPRQTSQAEIKSATGSLVDTLAEAAQRIPPCPTCGEPTIAHPMLGDAGPRVRVLCEHQKDLAEQEVRRREHWNRYDALLARYGKAMPARVHHGARLETVDSEPAKARAKAAALRFVAHWDDRRAEGAGMYFMGDVGTGKSYLASAVAGALEDGGYFTSCLVASDLPALAKDPVHGPLLVAMIEASDLVVLDDLGSDSPTEFGMMTLFRVIDLCYRTRKPLIVTSNMGADDLRAHYTRCLRSWSVPTDEAVLSVDRNVSRLREMCAPFAFIGADQRASRGHTWAEDLT